MGLWSSACTTTSPKPSNSPTYSSVFEVVGWLLPAQHAGAVSASHAQNSSAARPLPSQRAGSFQNSPGANAAAMGSRDRLRARLQGGNSGRSSPSGLNVNAGQMSYNGSQVGQDSGGNPHMGASEPWSNSGNPYGDPAYNASSNPYGKQRPHGPR